MKKSIISLIAVSALSLVIFTACGGGNSSSNSSNTSTLEPVNGKDGFSLLTGKGEPKTDLGKINDSYIDIDSWDFYVKETTGWVKQGNLKGGQDHQGLDFYLTDNNTYYVGQGLSAMQSKVVIPATYNGLPVTGIIHDGFYKSNVKDIEIPDSVTSIGNSAFDNCYNLSSVTIPDSVTSIGEYAFFNCSSLTSVTIGNSVTSIGYRAFYNCSSLTSVTIGNSVASIGDYAFSNCSELKDVYYLGSKEEAKSIIISSGNTDLTSATWHYSK